eukprot:GHVN01026031.1.p1 GENE.GHVN01026031.1~~GHVN01026031.1.p1  ORF type:complete len:845 (+),score=179.99 GHVN01026031.1:2-2536(+)
MHTPLGLRTPIGMDGDGPSLNDLGEARGTVLSVKLDKVMDSVSGQTVIDPKPYLVDMQNMRNSNTEDIADVKKARLLLKSVVDSNPKHPPGWIAFARCEEYAGRLQSARELIAEGCRHCPTSEDIWLEAARLEKPTSAKAVFAKAVKLLPQSVRLWREAANMESDLKARSRVLRKALEFIPNSKVLWKETIQLEDEKNARVLLTRAVECLPTDVDMWLALARLSPYLEAKKVLNQAVKNMKTSPDLWVAGAKLEETHSEQKEKMVEMIMGRAVEDLSKEGASLDREKWLTFAEQAEREGYVKTAKAIVKATMNVNVQPDDRERVWRTDAEASLSRDAVETARQIYASALQVLKTRESLWLSLADLETKHGSPEALNEVLKQGVTYCPQAEVLWLMAAKQRWLAGDVPGARQILSEAFSANVNTEKIALAAVKLERENKEFQRARVLLGRARLQTNTPQVWMQSVQLERQLANYREAHSLVTEGLTQHPTATKLWIISGQLFLEEVSEVSKEIARREEGGERDERGGARKRSVGEVSNGEKRNVKKARKERVTNEGDEGSESDSSDSSESSDDISGVSEVSDLRRLSLQDLNTRKEALMKQAANQFQKGVEARPGCVPLWCCFIDCFRRTGELTKARALLERARHHIPKSEELWLKALEIEKDAGNANLITHVASKALQEVPSSGLLWAEAIALEPRAAQNAKSVDALKHCENDPVVIVAVAKIFWRGGKLEKTRNWLSRAVTYNESLGDAWGTWMAFELENGTPQKQLDVMAKFAFAEPNRGHHWNKLVKRVENWGLKFPEKMRKFLEVHYEEIFTKVQSDPEGNEEILNVLYGRVVPPQPSNI